MTILCCFSIHYYIIYSSIRQCACKYVHVWYAGIHTVMYVVFSGDDWFVEVFVTQNDQNTLFTFLPPPKYEIPPLVVYPLQSLKWSHQKTNQLIRRCHPYARESASRAVLTRMQLTPHATRPTPHGASGLVKALCARSVKT